MTAKEKALELVHQFDEKRIANYKHIFPEWSKQCALIAVNEIIKDRERLKDALFYECDYWQEVKQEIEKL